MNDFKIKLLAECKLILMENFKIFNVVLEILFLLLPGIGNQSYMYHLSV